MGHSATASFAAGVAPRPDLAGARVHAPSNPALYLIDSDGTRHHIPDPTTYNQLFVDWNGLQTVDTTAIAAGPELTSGVYLAWDGISGDPAFLVTNSTKRWIRTPEAFNKFYFNWVMLQQVPKRLLDGLPAGPDIY